MSYLAPQQYRRLGIPIGILSASGDNYTYSGIEILSTGLNDKATINQLRNTGVSLDNKLNQLNNTIFSGITSVTTLLTTGNQWYQATGNVPMSSRDWAGIASSLDGSYILATAQGGTSGVFESFNSGKNFTYLNLRPNALSFQQQGVAVSDDGTVAIAAHSTGLFIKRNGVWNSTLAGSSTRNRWYAADISSDGKYMVATQEYTTSGSIWMSSDSGISWVLKLNRVGTQFGDSADIAPKFRTVSISDDAKYQLVANYNNEVIISYNSGNDWFPATGLPIASWYSSAISANGQYMMLGRVSTPPSAIFVSNNFGLTWEEKSNWPNPELVNLVYGVALSKDAKTQAVVSIDPLGTQSNIFISYNSGNSWTRETGVIANQYKLFPFISDSIISINTSYSNLWFKEYNNNNYLNILPPNQELFYTKYNQTISGIKNFSSRPTVNNTGVLLQGEALTNRENVIYTTGNQSISGIKNFAIRPTVNNTGVLLQGEAAAAIQNVVYTTGEQTISGKKTFAAQNYTFSGVNLILEDGATLLSKAGSSGIFNGANIFNYINTFETTSQNNFKGPVAFYGATRFYDFPVFKSSSIGFTTDPNDYSEDWYFQIMPYSNGDFYIDYTSSTGSWSATFNLKSSNLINASGLRLTGNGVSYNVQKLLTVNINGTNYKLPLF